MTSDMYTKKLKIPDIAWPTFFDSYRESMLITRLETMSLSDLSTVSEIYVLKRFLKNNWMPKNWSLIATKLIHELQ